MREKLIDLFLSMNPWGCPDTGKGDDCPSCQRHAEEMADRVLEVVGS